MRQKIMTFVEGVLLMTMLISMAALDGESWEIAATLVLISVIGLYICFRIEAK